MNNNQATSAAETQALMAMTEAEVDAELRLIGIDPEAAAQMGADAVNRALEQADYTGRGYDPLGAVALRVERSKSMSAFPFVGPCAGLTQCDMHDDESY